jgi:hypothetical protein
MLSTNLAVAPDPDDSWQLDRAGGRVASGATPRVADAGGGYQMVWENPEAASLHPDASLRFHLLAPDRQPAGIEAYMGMQGHAVVRRQDGAVFAHVHPVGTFSMAAQQFFVEGKPLKSSADRTSTAGPPGAPPSHPSHTNQVSGAGAVAFPYAFPEPGAYRVWVQMKTGGRILTGVFDTDIASAK